MKKEYKSKSHEAKNSECMCPFYKQRSNRERNSMQITCSIPTHFLKLFRIQYIKWKLNANEEEKETA